MSYLRPFRIKWKLRWSILTLFLLAIGTCCLAIISYSYKRNYQEINNLSITRMKIIGQEVLSTINAEANQAFLTTNLIRGLIKNENDISINNQELISYLIHVIESIPIVQTVTIGAKNGNLIEIADLFDTEQSDNIPVNARYKVLFLDHSGTSPIEFIEYRDEDYILVAKKEVHNVDLDPRTQPWFTIVSDWPHIHWTSDYSSYSDSIIANLTSPISNPSGQVVAVLNIGLSLAELSNITSYIKLGKSGKIYILNEAGQVIIPISSSLTPHSPLMQLARSDFIERKQSTFKMEKDGVTYLVNCATLPLEYETSWLIITIIPFDDFFESIVRTQQQTILISIAILLTFSIVGFFLTSRYISSPITAIAEQSHRLQQLDFKNYESVYSHIAEIDTLTTSSRAMRNALSSFARYIPKEVIKMLIEQNKEIDLGGQRGELTILFTDIENFTTTTEMLPIEALLSSLSEYFEFFSKIIVEAEGTIDKYIGDSIMALWNAPIPVADSSKKACLAALKCLKNSKLLKTDNPFLSGRTRFGIHHGDVIFGNIGTTERMCYTAIGNAVNTAERLENLNKQYHSSILISESVHERLSSEFVTRPLDFVYMKGRGNGITVYELVGLSLGPSELLASPEEIAFCRDFTAAYRQFHEGMIEDALEKFETLYKQSPSDYSTKLYLDKVKHIHKNSTGQT